MCLFTNFVLSCAVEDLERNNGMDRPYFMSKELMGVLGVKDRKQDPSVSHTLTMEDISAP